MNISIIVPVYNATIFLEACLNSILKEMRKDDELIIIDDGSSDDSSKIYNPYKKASNVCIVKQKNSGVSVARNNGIKRATKEYVMFVDADDYLLTGWRDMIEKAKNTDIVYIGKNIKLDYNKQQLIDNMIGVRKEYTYSRTPFSKLFRRTMLQKDKINFKKGIIHGEDLLFNIEALMMANTFSVLCESIYVYRINEKSSSRTFNEKFFESDILFQKELSRLKDKHKIIADRHTMACVENAIICIIRRVSMLPLKQRKKYWKILEQDPYAEFLKTFSKSNNKKNNIVITLAKMKRYNISALPYQIKRKIRKFKPKKINEQTIMV